MFPTAINLAAGAGNVLSGVLDGGVLDGVLNEIVGVLPTVVPVVITCLGIRKGISFVIGMLRSA